MMEVSQLNLKDFMDNKHWDFSNKILYDLCINNFRHDKDEVILTKVLFIGRIYAAAIERRRENLSANNDDFYIDKVVKTFKDPILDKHLENLKLIKKISMNNIHQILLVHHYLMKTISKITGIDKRSFCSKYLHFHLPNLFFIFDSRASTALKEFTSTRSDELKGSSDNIDLEYATFFYKCFDLKTKIDKHHKTNCSPRQLDNLLIDIANKKSKKQKS